MSVTADPAFIGDVPPRRRSAQPAPLDLWLRTLMIALLLTFGTGLWFVFGRTPMQTKIDVAEFGAQLAEFDAQVSRAQVKGEKPIKMIFIGTSRMRNVTLDTPAVAAAARAAGVERPLASTVLGVDWGGFERFRPLLPMIEQRHPDVIVVMPEFFAQDFAPRIRLRMGITWLQSLMWGQEYRAFPINEAVGTVCQGFADPPGTRDARDRTYLTDDPDGPGPREARAFVQRMAREGTLVMIADVPISTELAAIRPPRPRGWPSPAVLGLHGDGIRLVPMPRSLDHAAYCDHAHINPEKAEAWRGPFFQRIAGTLNNLPAGGAIRAAH